MSLLARANVSSRGRHFSVRSLTALQQLNLYSTKTTPSTPKTQRLTRAPKPSQSPSPPERTEKPTVSMLDWPKPTEIPYQERVANSVTLVGRVKTPVQFDSANPDGNHFAAAVISQEHGGGNSSLLIPVVFEGDLAHVLASHVKENDRVFVSGQLSMGPTRFSFSEGLGKLHIVGENLNFVVGSAKYASGQKPGIEKPLDEGRTEEVVKNDEEFNQKWKEALENAKVKKFLGEGDWASSSVSKQLEQENGSGKSVVGSARKKILDLWRDLLESPKHWWDYRGHKSNRLVKEKYPDFRHKESGDALWADSAPHWILTEVGKLEFDIKFMKAKPAPGSEGLGERKEFGVEFGKAKQDGQGEISWKDVVENPNNWWDNRLDKRNPRAPDFKHKTTGEGLWLSNSPDWVMSRLSEGKKNTEAL